ncbi:MAG: 30S ribosomal protein S5 [Mycoplasmataceae bacterium]|jgi:small subunit ribosomal protein S5|nr:30S ribosomal protein S5 [Mycoplasmataceae bacterium]
MGFEEKVVGIKRISKTTKGGRHMRFSALVVIGDKNGKVGYGVGKSTEVPNAIKKAIKNARKNIVEIIMNKRFTLYHEILGRHGASSVLLKPAPEGTGIIAGGAIRAVIELVGFKDIYTKNKGSNTALNMVQATIDGLINQRHPSLIAKLRDKDIKEL